MKIYFVWNPFERKDSLVLHWYVYLDNSEEKYKEEILQEISLNISEQQGGRLI